MKGLVVSDDIKMDGIVDQNEQQASSFEALSRRDKRSLIFHLLYAAESFDYQTSVESIVENFNRGFSLDIPLNSDVVATAQVIIEQRDFLDNTIKPLLSNWRFDRLGVCTKLILRFAIFELTRTDTPSVIIINEAIELAKCFAEKDAFKFINGILDEALKHLNRPEHIDAQVSDSGAHESNS